MVVEGVVVVRGGGREGVVVVRGWLYLYTCFAAESAYYVTITCLSRGKSNSPISVNAL